MTRVLVTGAAGYIGQRLTESLASDGHVVRALVRSPVVWTGEIEQVVGDLVAQAHLAQEISHDIDVVIHLAGANEIATSKNPERAMSDTLLAATRIAESGAPRAIYLSTVHVYGAALVPGALVSEDTPPSPMQPYATARLACEDAFARSDAPTLIFRLTNGVGAPWRPDTDRWTLVANELCREGATRGTLTLRTSGAQWRDFIALRDVDAALRAVVQTPTFGNGIFNLASGSSVTIRDLAGIVQDAFFALGEPRPELSAPPPTLDPVGPYRIDIDALAHLGIRPHTPLRDAVRETAQFCLEHREALRS